MCFSDNIQVSVPLPAVPLLEKGAFELHVPNKAIGAGFSLHALKNELKAKRQAKHQSSNGLNGTA